MTDLNVSDWPSAWIRAALPTAILACLEEESLHGYAIALRLEDRGFGKPKGGSLYPALSKLESAGAVHTAWVEGDSGPGKRTYTLTAAGRRRLDDEREAWERLVEALHPNHRTAVLGRV